ncbi:MAG: DUF5915 domain-containing protein, partial [Polyangiaceae bacterium]|nr:DUF5915 domain-containing protein [Polyangiaceae bacterium]
EGKKESKSKGNYTPPEIILDRVAMDFAVVDDPAAAPGVVVVGRDDLDGLDLQDGSRVRVTRGGGGESLDLTIRASKMRRRIAALHPSDRATLGVIPVSSREIAPVLVPRLPSEERVVIEDPSTPAPGADAFRWFFYAASPPWSATRHSLGNVRALQKEFAVKLRNVYSFFTIYGNIDGFDPHDPTAAATRDASALPELDRWIRSEVALAVRDITASLDAYDAYAATGRLTALVDGLSNWWVRRSRARFWRSGWDDDKRSAYRTLYDALVTITKLSAPFTPYAAEAMWQNLVARPARRAGAGATVPESVHLADWPEVDEGAIHQALSDRIGDVRALVSLGLQVRTQAKLRVRQPLRSATLVTPASRERAALASDAHQIADELNVLDVRFVPMAEATDYVEFKVKPSFRSLGQRGLGKEAQALKKVMGALRSHEASAIASTLLGGGTAMLEGVELRRDDIEVELVAKPGFAAAGDRAGVVLLDTQIDDELRELGFVREIINRVQTMRKELALEFTDRILLAMSGSERVRAIVGKHKGAIAHEVLAVEVHTEPLATPGSRVDMRDVDIEGEAVRLEMARA